MASNEELETAIRHALQEKLGGIFQSVQISTDDEDDWQNGVIRVTVTVNSREALEQGNVFNLPNDLRRKLLSMQELRFPIIHYHLAGV